MTFATKLQAQVDDAFRFPPEVVSVITSFAQPSNHPSVNNEHDPRAKAVTGFPPGVGAIITHYAFPPELFFESQSWFVVRDASAGTITLETDDGERRVYSHPGGTFLDYAPVGKQEYKVDESGGKRRLHCSPSGYSFELGVVNAPFIPVNDLKYIEFTGGVGVIEHSDVFWLLQDEAPPQRCDHPVVGCAIGLVCPGGCLPQHLSLGLTLEGITSECGLCRQQRCTPIRTQDLAIRHYLPHKQGVHQVLTIDKSLMIAINTCDGILQRRYSITCDGVVILTLGENASFSSHSIITIEAARLLVIQSVQNGPSRCAVMVLRF